MLCKVTSTRNDMTRAQERGDLEVPGGSWRTLGSFMCQAARIWNITPADIKNAKTVGSAKLKIREFVKGLPV